jgi:uncharacterized protein YukE
MAMKEHSMKILKKTALPAAGLFVLMLMLLPAAHAQCSDCPGGPLYTGPKIPPASSSDPGLIIPKPTNNATLLVQPLSPNIYSETPSGDSAITTQSEGDLSNPGSYVNRLMPVPNVSVNQVVGSINETQNMLTDLAQDLTALKTPKNATQVDAIQNELNIVNQNVTEINQAMGTAMVQNVNQTINTKNTVNDRAVASTASSTGDKGADEVKKEEKKEEKKEMSSEKEEVKSEKPTRKMYCN